MAVSLNQFVERLESSGLLSAEDLSAVSDSLPGDRKPKDVRSLAKHLVIEGLLTKYQAAAVYKDDTAHLVLGDYVVLDKLGEGGMGEVLKAQHRRMDRIVALKILPAAKVDSADAIKRFHQEVKAAAKLNHPNIVTAFDAGEQNGIHYLVMEYVDGKDLSSLAKEQGQLPVQQAVDYVVQAAIGLGYAHEKGVVHRDIKPGNLLLSSEGEVKVLDMGLARLNVGDMNDVRGGQGDGLTQSGQVMGTVDYMAPEQALDTRRADHRADIYALGCTLYRLLAGEVPFAGETLMMTLVAHREDPIPSLRETRPDVSPALDTVYQRMMAKNPDERQQSMVEVVEQLQEALVARAAPAPARPSSASGIARPPAAPAAPPEPEPPAVDMALSAFLQAAPQTAAPKAKAKKRDSASAFEETINRGSSEEGTGDRLEKSQPADLGFMPVSDQAVAKKKKPVRSTRAARQPWLLPTIVGGAFGLVAVVGLVIALSMEGDPQVDLAADDSPNTVASPREEPLPVDPIQPLSTVAAATTTPPPTANINPAANTITPPATSTDLPDTVPSTPPANTALPAATPSTTSVAKFGDGAPPLAVVPFTEPQAKAYQQAWADFLGLPVNKEVELHGGQTMSFMLIPPGEFLMGSSEQGFSTSSESKQPVILTRPYYLGTYEVTQTQFENIMRGNGGKDVSDRPAGMVVWPHAVAFCNKLSEHDNRLPCYNIEGPNVSLIADGTGFRLPTEAEWEFACRAGTTTPWYFGADPSVADNFAWFGDNSGRASHPVGAKLPNAFGLFDMVGNHWEWCFDWYAPWQPTETPLRDPTGPATGTERVERGRFWISSTNDLQSWVRHKNNPNMTYPAGGFRVVMTIPESTWLNKPAAKPPEEAEPTIPDAGTATKGLIVPADGWVDLLPLVDMADDVVDGDWKQAGETMGVTGIEKNYARLMLPVVPKGSYALEIDLTRTKGTDDVAVLLPVAGRHVVFHTCAFRRWAGVDMIGGAGIFKSDNPTRAASPLQTGKPLVAQVAAIVQDEQVRFVIQMNDEKTSDVNVPITDLDEHAQWHANLTDKSRLALGAYEVDAVIHSVKLKMLDGEAQILDSARPSVAIQPATP